MTRDEEPANDDADDADADEDAPADVEEFPAEVTTDDEDAPTDNDDDSDDAGLLAGADALAAEAGALLAPEAPVTPLEALELERALAAELAPPRLEDPAPEDPPVTPDPAELVLLVAVPPSSPGAPLELLDGAAVFTHALPSHQAPPVQSPSSVQRGAQDSRWHTCVAAQSASVSQS